MAVTDSAIDKIKDMIMSGELHPGDRLRIETPGGGGHGLPNLFGSGAL